MHLSNVKNILNLIKNNRLGIIVVLVIGVALLLSYKKFLTSNNSSTNNVLTKTENTICKDCNILMFHLDTLNANHLPCNGYERNVTPNLCKFGKDNIYVKNFYSNAPWTLPSTVSIMTSLYPEYHGVNFFGDKLSPKTAFLPEILQNNGYATYLHLPKDVSPLPFNDVYNRGITKLISDGTSQLSDLDKALDNFYYSVKEGKKTFSYIQTYYVHSPYVIEDRKKIFTTKNFENIPLNRQDYEKNFYSMNLREYILSQENGNLKNRTPGFYEKLRKANTPKTVKDLVSVQDNNWLGNVNYLYYGYLINTPEKVEYAKALYDQLVFELDEWIGKKLVPFINSPEVSKNTIVIITSDHGEEFMEHGNMLHQTVYDSNIRVPLMVYIPGITHKLIETPAQSVDLVPTILEGVGIPQSEFNFQGESLIGLINRQKPVKRLLFADGFRKANKIIRKDNWKLFLNNNNNQYVPAELYDTKLDPGEKINVINSNQQVVLEIMKEYQDFNQKWSKLLPVVTVK